ncbi:hypothetical protein MD484_g6767, partial [Candolleomyces efflorescens]
MSPAVEAGHDILIPLFDGETAKIYTRLIGARTSALATPSTTASPRTTSPLFPLFIAAEFYKTSTSANPKHITKVGQLQQGEGYKIKVNSELQYGQKNAAGELRFVVYHDKERKPYQHRFIETALASVGAAQAQALAQKFGYGGVGDQAANLLKCFVGDYLRTF